MASLNFNSLQKKNPRFIYPHSICSPNTSERKSSCSLISQSIPDSLFTKHYNAHTFTNSAYAIHTIHQQTWVTHAWQSVGFFKCSWIRMQYHAVQLNGGSATDVFILLAKMPVRCYRFELLYDDGGGEEVADGSQVQEINCSTFQLEKVVEPTRS